METIARTTRQRAERVRFSLAAVFEYTTICAALCSVFRCTGIGANVCLMAMALALSARLGMAALLTLMAALLVADAPRDFLGGTGGLERQFATIVIAASLCGWYVVRGRMMRPTSSDIATHDVAGS